MKRNISSVIFDLDGTLIDTLADITDAVNALFKKTGLPSVTQARIRSLIGEGLPNLLSLASGQKQPETIAQMVEDYRQAYLACMLQKSALYPGIAELLTKLYDWHMPMAVLSNKPHEFTEPICNALLADWPFVKCWGHKPNSPRKPDPATALELANTMGCPASEACFVGDSTVDIDTAKNAGMMSIAVTWGYHDRKPLESAKPSALASDATELQTIISAFSLSD